MSRLLTQDEMEILGCLEHYPDKPLAYIAKVTHHKISRVQYLIQKLREECELVIRPFTNPLMVGMQSVAIYSSTAALTEKRKVLLQKFVNESSHVLWCSEFIGDYHLGLTLLCRNMAEIPIFLDKIISKTGIEFTGRVLSCRIRYVYFSRKYLSPQRKPIAVDLSAPGEPVAIDALDGKLLHFMAEGRYSSLREVARHLGESPATIDRRYKRLQKVGVIVGTLVDLPPRYLGRQAYRILIVTRAMNGEMKKSLLQFCREHPIVICFTEALGQFDIEMIVEAPSPEQVTTIVQRLNEKFGLHIHTSATLTEVNGVKWSLFPGVD